ncbi:MAG: sigma-70 family RNA polymerase sigma factor [Firmicutes bacterium]|nr:sigma-70 family RNA polymerase sigma factor [Bacillota bacterium]
MRLREACCVQPKEEAVIMQNQNIEQYKEMVKIIAAKYKSSGIEQEDLYQEGYLAVLKALPTFEEGKGAKIETYLSTCINNRLIDVIRKNKTIELVEPAAINQPDYLLNEIVSMVKKEFSNNEYKMWVLSNAGFSYAEIAQKLGVDSKTVDNKLFKIKKKIRSSYGE